MTKVICEDGLEWYIGEESNSADYDDLINAYEKQIPKHPTNVRQHVDHKTGYCPSCSTRLAHFGDMNYCYGCGSKLDWEIEDAE